MSEFTDVVMDIHSEFYTIGNGSLCISEKILWMCWFLVPRQLFGRELCNWLLLGAITVQVLPPYPQIQDPWF